MRERKRIRLLGFDYTKVGAYFITSVVKNRTCVFGNIKNETIELTRCGEIVRQQWVWLQQQYPYVMLDDFVVMPNHIHGIVNIVDSVVGDGRDRPLHRSWSREDPRHVISRAFVNIVAMTDQ